MNRSPNIISATNSVKDFIDNTQCYQSLEAPDFKRNTSAGVIRQCECSREASQNARPGMIK
jgi:hypothetical protein